MEHFENELENSALQVNSGVPQPPSIHPGMAEQLKKLRRKTYPAEVLAEGILRGDRTILSQAITLVESLRTEDQKLASKIIDLCLPHTGKSVRIGITGVPGVGKSTFIESFGSLLTARGHKLAVLAIDPSSGRSKGSILGDKTRMEHLANNPQAFVRPSPSAGSLGGVARKTREAIFLCEAAGYDIIFIETVGVGQSETLVHSMVDFFLLLMLAGAGDELQGIKKGIMEMADALVITKADGDNAAKAAAAKVEYAGALHFFPLPESGRAPRVLTCSSKTRNGLEDVWADITDYLETTHKNGFFKGKRKEQARHWMYQTINESLLSRFYENPLLKAALARTEEEVMAETISPFDAANRLLEAFNPAG